MKLVVGLGNPGEKYKNTRHNVGFMVLDKMQAFDLDGFSMPPFRLENQYSAQITQTGGIGENRITIAKPMTYMNLSGESVKKIKDYFKIETEDVIVVCDDLNLELGVVRVRRGGSYGGHNGLKSVIDNIGSDFWRVRIGIGSNKSSSNTKQTTTIAAEDYVLTKFSENEMKIIDQVVDKTGQYILKSISSGMNEETLRINL